MSWSTWPGYGPDSYQWTLHNDNAGSPASSSTPPYFARRMGIVETKFDAAAQKEGMADMFVRLRVTLDAEDASTSSDAFFGRMVLAWAALRARHLALAYTAHDAEDGEHGRIHPLVQPREFRLVPPTSSEDALRRALETILVEETDDVEEAMDRVQKDKVLNGPRVLLAQDDCLARLLLFRNSKGREHGVVLVISHIITDGISVVNLVRELFDLVASANLPSPLSPPTLVSLDEFLTGHASPPSWTLDDSVLAPWRIFPTRDELRLALTLPTEAHLPSVPLPAKSSVSSPTTVTPTGVSAPAVVADEDVPPPSVARRRWFWAISRTIIFARQGQYPRTLHFTRAEPLGPQARTEWPTLKLGRETSSRLFAFSKQHKLSPSMLMYSIISLAIASIFAREHSTSTYQPIVIGFPCSIRPYLSEITQHQTANDLAIRLTFGSIHLPNIAHSTDDAARLRRDVVRRARLAKAQFIERFSPKSRALLIADKYFKTLDRLLNGTGENPIPLNEPKTALNASMIGDLDRLLPRTFTLPNTPSSTITLSDIFVGTRLHRGEGMLMEVYTWDGRMTVSLGFDEQIVKRELVEEILEQIELISRAVV